MIAEIIGSGLLPVLSGGLGGLLRLVPALIKHKSESNDRDHEYRMFQAQLQADAQRQSAASQLAGITADAAIQAENLKALQEAIKGQSQQTGIKIIDAISATVRPFVTYWWLALYTAAKGISIYMAINEYEELAQFAGAVWTPADAATLSMILSFWFVDRAIIKGK